MDLGLVATICAIFGAVGGAGFALGRFLLGQYAGGTIAGETVVALRTLNETLLQQLDLTKGDAARVPGLVAENQQLRTVIGAGHKVDALDEKLTPILTRNATALEQLAKSTANEEVWRTLHLRSLAVLELIATQLHIGQEMIAAEVVRIDRDSAR